MNSMPRKKYWYRKSGSEALEEQNSTLHTGLKPEEVTRRENLFGPNRIQEAKRKSAFKLLISQFADLLIVVLLGAAVIAGFLGEPQDVVAILAIIILNAILGFTQEFRAEKAIAALKALTAPRAHVRRQGKTLVLPAFQLVPGDIVLLDAGQLVPADMRLVETHELKIDESTLTGESQAAEKIYEPILAEHLPVADQRNMAFKGTLVVSGRATGLVTSIGMDTELGQIAGLLREEVEVKTPLQNRIARFAYRIAVVVLILCVVIFIVGMVRGEEPALMFFTAVSLAVAAIPEALPAVVTVALAIGARGMSRRNALVRRLPAVEALGSVTYICTDKTGTLTENRMSAEGFHVGGRFSEYIPEPPARDSTWDRLLLILAQSNDATEGEDGRFQGDPTEVALLRAAFQRGLSKAELEKKAPRIAEIPFSSERGMMTTVHQDQGRWLVYSKGAPESIFKLCKNSSNLGKEKEAAEEMAHRGMRVLAFAWKEVEEGHREWIESDLIFAGLVGLIDPPRPEAKGAIDLCKSAGIRIIMITGDHPATAAAVARRIGILEKEDRFNVVSGAELSRMSDEELKNRIRAIPVFARMAPDQKIRIVKALQSVGEIVSMTGDGVNDAPALRRADIGVAMGKSGTDVAREASHMILLDDHFATMVAAVQEGRKIYDNIRKFVRFALAGNSGELWTLFLAPFFNLPVPLLPIHILWVNLVTDGLPGLALAVEPEESGIMSRSPRRPQESIFSRGLWQHCIWVGLLIAAVTLSIQAWALHSGSAHWQSMTFTVITLIQMGHVLAIRSEKDSLFQQGVFSNLPLLGAVVLTVFLQLGTLYIPALNRTFKTAPLSGKELLICLAASCTVFIAVEFEKIVKNSLIPRFWKNV